MRPLSHLFLLVAALALATLATVLLASTRPAQTSLVAPQQPAPAPPAPQTIYLTTVPLSQHFAGATVVTLSGQLPGKAQLTLDTNAYTFSDLGGAGTGTLKETTPIDVQLVAVEPQPKGGALYDIQGVKGLRLRLAVLPNHIHRFLLLDEAGKVERVVTAENTVAVMLPTDVPPAPVPLTP